ncbi:MAG: hypothetical protein KZQ74_14625 [gamma proteobacterium symbiont of Bathyaustriella thionipta]|nr:hypothetical protein [gamma proteobacterium symbiont of Bathyaustriella thionipta]MCU7958106.1 hypothetical protein [gamma proteobacterium symbiont of Bathyaustriella thionipta]MCU7968397.1 hypothetical protein [gamma proteobacterium symbiont of Bathyaustriella thionipta]
MKKTELENNLAPIGLTVYGRLEHTIKTIEALKNNNIACESKLYIFSDGPRKGDEDKVTKIREYLRTIDGFKEIKIIERTENSRIKNNRGGMKYLLDKYGKVIWMAEDIVTAPGFLTFINEALNFYEKDSNILSITGYTPPIKIPPNYNHDIFSLGRFNAWGMGIWKEKYQKINNITIDDFHNIDKKRLKLYGDDIYKMVGLDVSGKINALDVRAMYLQYHSGMVTVYPRMSLVQNIGCDGSGIHCSVSDRFLHEKLWDKVDEFIFVSDIKINEKIRKSNYKFRSSGLKGKVANLSRLIGIYPVLKKIQNKF